MNQVPRSSTAKILAFPARCALRPEPQQRRSVEVARLAAYAPQTLCSTTAWYHEAAVAEAAETVKKGEH